MDMMPSSLLDLPAEIRIHIYKELLISPIKPSDLPQKRRIILARRLRSPRSRPHSPADFVDLTESDLQRIPLVYPAILATCRRVNQEATPVLYTYNTFTAHPTLLTSLPSLIYEHRPCLYPHLSQLRSIRRWQVTVRLDCDARYTADKLKQAFDGVEQFTLVANESMYRASGLENLLLFAGIRGVGKARVTGSVERVVAEWLERMMMTGEVAPVPSSLEDWRLTAMARDGGLKSEREGDGYYDLWTHGNR